MRETNPVLLRLWRNSELESLHRGVWALVDTSGAVLEAAGDADQSVFPRSATKSLQALPLLESGALETFGFDHANLALALASHSGEPVHVDVARDGLAKIGLGADALRCGPQRPSNEGIDAPADRITNNCSGKHTGFLAVAKQLGVDPARYLDRTAPVQERVIQATAEMCDLEPETLGTAVDGCSAPTFRMPLRSLALGLARVANPAGLEPARAAACKEITVAARTHPVLVAGTHERFCTDLLRVTEGRVFGKIGAEGVYALGVVDAGVGFACKIDDGSYRALYPVLLSVLHRHGLVTDAEVDALSFWGAPLRHNWDGIEIGHSEVV